MGDWVISIVLIIGGAGAVLLVCLPLNSAPKRPCSSASLIPPASSPSASSTSTPPTILFIMFGLGLPQQMNFLNSTLIWHVNGRGQVPFFFGTQKRSFPPRGSTKGI
jgi:hypothetical protein